MSIKQEEPESIIKEPTPSVVVQTAPPLPGKPSTDPIEAQAKADVLRWLMQPETEMGKRTFSQIGSDGVYPIAALLETCDFIEELLSCKLELMEEKDVIPITQKPPPDDTDALIKYYQYQQRKLKVKYVVDPEIRMESIHNFISNFLELSVGAGKDNRAKLLADTIKNMNRPAMNPMGMLGGLFNKEEPENLEEVPASE